MTPIYGRSFSNGGVTTPLQGRYIFAAKRAVSAAKRAKCNDLATGVVTLFAGFLLCKTTQV